MSTDTRVTFVPGARIRDVAKVIGVAAGLPASLEPLDPDSIHLVVSGVDAKTSWCPEMVTIVVNDPSGNHVANYFFEWDSGLPGCTGILAPCDAFWIAVFKKVVGAFGGEQDYNDCDDTEVDFRSDGTLRPAPDGEAWETYQRAMLAVGPVTPQELAEAETHARYKVASR